MATVLELIDERFKELTEIQKIAIPHILNGEHTLILAQTGSGKTEAVLLPVLEKIKVENKLGICALYITPLRALNRDLLKRFSWWCERLGISYAVRHGDTSVYERAKHRKNPPQILLITCETLQALFLGKIMRKHLSNVKFVIVDEVHDILDNKRGAQLSLALERLEELTTVNDHCVKFQRIALSATVSNEEEAAKLVFGSRPYYIAEAGKNRKMNIDIKYFEKQEQRVNEIKALSESAHSLIFVNTRGTAEELGATLKKLNTVINIHHGSLSKDVRITAEDKFKSGEVKALVATSSLELGIDIGNIETVIQYGSPRRVSRLIQRVGRSGHTLDKTPHGIVFPVDFDDKLEVEAIKLLAENGWMEKTKVEKAALDVIAHQLIGICLDHGKIDLKSVHATFSRSYAYGISFAKLKLIALQLYSEGLLYYDEISSSMSAEVKATKRAREYYCSNITTIPKEKHYLLHEVSSDKIIASLDEKFVLNLEPNTSFLSKGQPWQVIDITEDKVLVEPSSALDIIIPSWAGEEIPVEFEVAQRVGQLRKAYKENVMDGPVADDRTIVIEIINDLIIIHACFGNKVNEAIARILSLNLSRLIRESVLTVTDSYRIMIKLPFPLDEKHLLKVVTSINNPRAKLTTSLENSFLLKLKFTHVARLFGLFDEKTTATERFINMLRNSVIYEETLRSIFFRYFDIEKLEEITNKIEHNEIKIIIDKRKEPSFFAKLGIDRTGSRKVVDIFEPREAMITALKERTLTKTIEIECLNCYATRFIHIAGLKNTEKITCHKCSEQALTILEKTKEKNRKGKEYDERACHIASLIRNYGRRALIALSVYGIGPETAKRVLRKLHRHENTFYLDLLNAQKNFMKNKKYWKIN